MRAYVQYSVSAGELAALSMVAFMMIMFAITWSIMRASKTDVSEWGNIHLNDGVARDHKGEHQDKEVRSNGDS